jgi:hypothetical protein
VIPSCKVHCFKHRTDVLDADPQDNVKARKIMWFQFQTEIIEQFMIAYTQLLANNSLKNATRNIQWLYFAVTPTPSQDTKDFSSWRSYKPCLMVQTAARSLMKLWVH